ncbi:hypothetical protein [Prauserella rugosa]|uniref:Uncharacterized protein n=1 Tax=Prauserella rugosa TaxID=43354 RepID=A0A660CER9_9PSEU|nr:hypothetical protein HQ32_01380 [Prauserella sp. Am3]TWH19385.1 hypothetical protein JD82_01208 [Prauserella rugosa]
MFDRAGRVGVGDRVTYVPGCAGPGSRSGAPAAGRCVLGRVVAPPVTDPYAAVVWVPTRPDGAAEDTEPTWVRHDRLVEVGGQGGPSGRVDRAVGGRAGDEITGGEITGGEGARS